MMTRCIIVQVYNLQHPCAFTDLGSKIRQVQETHEELLVGICWKQEAAQSEFMTSEPNWPSLLS